MYGLDAQSGAVQWSVATGAPLESPVVANGVVYVTSRSGSFFALYTSYGGILAAGQTGFSFLGNPMVSDGVLYIDAYRSSAYAFSLLSGTNIVRAPSRTSLRPDRTLVAR